MEFWDVYDQYRKKTGKVIERGQPLGKDDYHLVVHVVIFNSKGEMLIQQRQSFKEGWPNMWDITVGGSALQGENSQQAAARELFEEISIVYDFKRIRPTITTNHAYGFNDIYILELDLDLHTLTLQYEEVQDVKWATKEEILSLITDHRFIPYYPSFIDLIFDTKTSMDIIKPSVK